MSDKIIDESKQKMAKAVEVLRLELAKIRTGRASIAILDDIKVEAYDQLMPLNQVATLGAPDPKQLTIQPWDVSIITQIEKAIQKSGLGLTPVNDGRIIRLPIPPLTEERRRELGKYVKKLGEDSKVAIRNVRRDAIEILRKMEKDGHVSEDEIKRQEVETQKLTDEHIKRIDEIIASKEKEIMTV